MKSPHMQRSLDARGKSSVSCDAPCRRSNATTGNPHEAEQLLTVASYPHHIHRLKNWNLGGSQATWAHEFTGA
jgi:hypothetical protein